MNKQLQMAVIFSALISGAYGFEYNVNGQVQNWSKFGFNNDKIDTAAGKYPTDSFSVLTASLGVNLNLGAGFKAGIAGTVGGMVFDNTKYQTTTDGALYQPQGIAWNYFGFWAGPDYRSTQSERTTRDWIIQNLFVSYEYEKYIEFKIGRFTIPGDWFSGYIQGAQIQTKAIPYTNVWAFATNKRASLGGKWLKDFKYLNQNISVDNGKGFYVFGIGADFKYQNFSAQPYLYAQDSRFIAPGFHLSYDSAPDFKQDGFRSKTELIMLFMNHVGPALSKATSYNNYDFNLHVGNPTAGKGGVSLLVKQTFEINNYNFGMMIYKNFGNPNEFLTPYGDPTGFDNYDNSVYDSTAWNNVFRRDAINGFLFGGGNYEKWNWKLLGRYTNSPRADEEALSLDVSYKFPLNITAAFRIEYYYNTTFAGYTLGYGSHLPKPTALANKVSQDRSYVSTSISYNF